MEVKDPVCGMNIEAETAAGKSEYRGKTYYFCSGSCKAEFDKHPGAFEGDQKETELKEPKPAAGAIYTCPMHPEVRERKPVSCPRCGMALEPESPRMPPARADVVAAYFVQVVIAIAVITFVIWAVAGPEPRMALALINSVAVLIIACPCALGLATPMSTGAAEKGVDPSNVEEFESITGKGAKGKVDRHLVALGNMRLMEDLRVDSGTLAEKAESMRKDGQTVMFLALEGKIAGLLGVADPVKETTPPAIGQLHREGLRVVMLTGDSRTTAEAVAKKLGIDEVIPEVLPDRKAEVVKEF